jgi:hypothetical protein
VIETVIAVIIGNLATALLGICLGFVIGLFADRPKKTRRGGTAKEVEQRYRSKMQDPDAVELCE